MITTVFSGVYNAPTGDAELDSLLSELRERTKLNWQCEHQLHEVKKWFRPPKVTHNCVLLLEVGGCLPYQLIMCASGDISKTKAYVIGYLSGLDHCRSVDFHTWLEDAKPLEGYESHIKDGNFDHVEVIRLMELAYKAGGV